MGFELLVRIPQQTATPGPLKGSRQLTNCARQPARIENPM
jgi:hypothetical protein